MSTKNKYQSVLELGESFGIKDGYVEEKDQVLHIGGIAENQYQKDRLWDEIKRIGGENPTDIQADIKVENTDVYALHTVKSGESLSKIAKYYYGDAMKYPKIFEANRDQLNNPDVIHPDQKLKIPKLS